MPLSAIAVMIGRSRLALYRVLWTGRVSADMATVLTPVIRAFEAGKLRFRRTSLRDAEPNRWQMIDIYRTASRSRSGRAQTLFTI